MESFDTEAPLFDRVTGRMKSLNETMPLLVSEASDVPADTKKVQLDVHGYKQSIEKENLQAEREVAEARAEHVTESSSTKREVKDNVESTTRVTKTRKVVQTVTAMKTRITCLGPVTEEMMTSIDEMFQKVPLLESTIFNWSLERCEGSDGIIITQRVVRPAKFDETADQGTVAGRSLIFIPREPIPYRQLSAATSDETLASRADTNASESELQAAKGSGFVLQIKRKEGLRTLWQETAPIKSSKVAEKLTRLELDLQENLFELLTSEASYGHSLSVVLTQLFNSDCVISSEVVVSCEGQTSPSETGNGSTSNSPAGIKSCTEKSTVGAEFAKLVKPLDRKALQLNLDELHRYSVSLLDSLKKCWITDSCLMKPAFVQLLADKLAEPAFRAAYLAYLRDVRYQQELLRELTQCSRPLTDTNDPSGQQPTDAALAAPDADEHLCVAERYSRSEVLKIRSLIADFHTLKCVENRALQSFLLLPLERLTKLKMCLESCEKLSRKVLGLRSCEADESQKESSPCALVQLGVDLEETARVLRECLSACCTLLDESNRLTHTCMQAEAQLQLDRLLTFEPAFGVRRISVVRTERLFLKDDSGALLRFSDNCSSGIRVQSLPVRLFLFSDLLLLTADAQRRDGALSHFGLSASSDTKSTWLQRLRRSMRKKAGKKRTAGNGPATGKFACGTADLARAVAGMSTLLVLDHGHVAPQSLQVALFDPLKASVIHTYPPEGCTPAVTTSPRRPESKKLLRSHSSMPAVLHNVQSNDQRRRSEVRRGKSLVNVNGQSLDTAAAVKAYCSNDPGKNSDCTPVLLLSVLQNSQNERADYALRFAAESDAHRWFDALAIAIANGNNTGNVTAATLHADSATTTAKESAQQCVVQKHHYASYTEELELTKGDLVVVQKRTSDGWCRGTLVASCKCGWFRANCLD